MILDIFSSNNVIMIYRIDGNISKGEDIVFRYDGFLNGHDGDILCMDHNGELLGTGSADKTVRLWSGVGLNMFRTTAEQQVSYKNDFTTEGHNISCSLSQTLTGHTKQVRCLAMTSTHVASGSWDRTCRQGFKRAQYILKRNFTMNLQFQGVTKRAIIITQSLNLKEAMLLTMKRTTLPAGCGASRRASACAA